jgi:GTP cyclohydrolase II
MNDIPSDSVTLGTPIIISTLFGDVCVRHVLAARGEGIVAIGKKPLPMPVPVRLQSSCLFSESFCAMDCDCADQLHASLKVIIEEGGILIYMYDEGRGVGLKAKMEAIGVQQRNGCDTATAFKHLGMIQDPRDYNVSTAVLLAILDPGYPIELLTNNPNKEKALRSAGLKIAGRRGLIIKKSQRAEDYLNEKVRVLGHIMGQ